MADYLNGVTIKVNGVSVDISAGERDAGNHAIVRYTIPVLWHGAGDTVTWEYSGGDIVAESGGAALATVTAQAVTNNCEYAALLDLQADTLALNDGDPISTWADQSGNGRDFTQTGDARPTKQTIGGYAAVVFDGVDDLMVGPNFADNLTPLASITVVQDSGDEINPWGGADFLTKLGSDGCDDETSVGWFTSGAMLILYQTSGDAFVQAPSVSGNIPAGRHIYSFEILSVSELHVYFDGANVDTDLPNGRTIGNGVTNFSNSEPVRFGMDGSNGDCDSWLKAKVFSTMLFSANPNATNRAALEARLAARYGITL